MQRSATSCANAESSAVIRHVYKTPEEKYKCCGLLNIIQHIDIYGRYRSMGNERRTRVFRPEPVNVTSITMSSPKRFELNREASETSMKNIDSKLSRFSVTTKVAGLYPGHDILSKRARRNRLGQTPSPVFSNYVPKR